jgi:protein gp37
MAETTIEWADFTFNPWMGCVKVSAECANCYAERDFDHRYQKVKWGGFASGGTRKITSDENWKKPRKWNATAGLTGVRPRVFCASLADVFEDWQGPILNNKGEQLFLFPCGTIDIGPDDADCGETDCHPLTMDDVRIRLFRLIDSTPNLDWLLLTKRPENILRMWPAYFPGGYIAEAGSMNQEGPRPNVWLGTSVGNQESANKRIPELLKCRELSPVLFLSCEPLLGPVRLNFTDMGDVDDVDWVIAGGESGPNARPSHPDWFRSLRDQCSYAGVPFLFKQWGEWAPRSQGFTASGNPEWGCMDRDGTWNLQATPWNGRDDDGSGEASLIRVGVKAAGRKLDGVFHDGFPEPRG